jgi:hypothetical protein
MSAADVPFAKVCQDQRLLDHFVATSAKSRGDVDMLRRSGLQIDH